MDMELLMQFFVIVGYEVAWTFPVWVVTLTVSFLVARVYLRLSPAQMLDQLEEKQNGALGAMFFVTALIVSTLVGRGLQSPTGDTPLLESLLWIVLAMILALVYFLVTTALLFRLLGRRKGETLRAYFVREIVEERNTAMMLFIGGLAVIPFTIIGHITL